MSQKISLSCTQCGSRNYIVPAKTTSTRIERKKFCAHCNAHTLHKQTL
ncbi:50S ribosomal protein L33 [Tetzosporium hominis]|uniref:Large ribosomal subunit protein bL33 n=2 Tax=Caryophanaceae TaxID=186818 RepID=A0A264W4S7_9BACL|nr:MULTISPECIES: 50S ribosomal protein L33 [Planococcaceae]OZS78572.1 50S ribosomal protein L33 [Tetzosporium hominis]PJK16361.1 50S ribosomal protein L33 [Chryseomicrobium excrementi]